MLESVNKASLNLLQKYDSLAASEVMLETKAAGHFSVPLKPLDICSVLCTTLSLRLWAERGRYTFLLRSLAVIVCMVNLGFPLNCPKDMHNWITLFFDLGKNIKDVMVSVMVFLWGTKEIFQEKGILPLPDPFPIHICKTFLNRHQNGRRDYVCTEVCGNGRQVITLIVFSKKRTLYLGDQNH